MSQRGHRDWDIPRGRDRWKDCGGDDDCKAAQKRADMRWSKPGAQARQAIWKHNNPLRNHRSRNDAFYRKLKAQIDNNIKTRAMHVPMRVRQVPRAPQPGQGGGPVPPANLPARQPVRPQNRVKLVARQVPARVPAPPAGPQLREAREDVRRQERARLGQAREARRRLLDLKRKKQERAAEKAADDFFDNLQAELDADALLF